MANPYAFPPIVPDWASDDNYAAGVDPWASTPTKNEPTAQTKAKGFIPEEPAPAQQLNYQIHHVSVAAKAFPDAVVGRANAVTQITGISGGSAPAYRIRGRYDLRRKRFWHTGFAADTMYWTKNGVQFTSESTGDANLGSSPIPRIGIDVNNNPASANYGDLLAVTTNGGNRVGRRKNGVTGAWSAITAASTPGSGSKQIAHDPINGSWIWVVGDSNSTNSVQNAPDAGGSAYTFTARTFAGTVADHSGKLYVAKNTGVTLIKTNAAVFNRSIDGGTSWSAVTTPTNIATEGAYAWCPGRNEWFYVDTAGAVYASPDGNTWTLRLASADNPMGTGVQDMDCFGSVVYAAYTEASNQGGIMYSLDGCLTWRSLQGVQLIDTGRATVYPGLSEVMFFSLKGPGTDVDGMSWIRGLPAIGLI